MADRTPTGVTGDGTTGQDPVSSGSLADLAKQVRGSGFSSDEHGRDGGNRRDGGQGGQGFEQPGDFVGPYQLVSVLGEGGFGTVWLAERRKPMVQRVALKIIKPGMDSRSVVARFEQERQTLAVMDHPNVARVFDGGVTDRGRPYFVMELVQGEPITTFCDRHIYTIRQRLELFIPVCNAVQHAHMKGVIHRDLKPSNILVELIDEKPVVKVIDFGIAKAITHAEWERTAFTQQGMVIGTPEYMSPEQVSGEADIDTRADVYSLGVVLYELLVGALPFDPRELRARRYTEIQRVIREVEPPTPSSRVRGFGSADEIASRRGEAPSALARSLRDELEWIPLNAMRKERDRRYSGPLALGEDITRYLEGRALQAAPESRAYIARKFVRRHRGPLAALAAVALVLVGGIAGTTTFALRAEAAAEREANQASIARTNELRAVQAAERAAVAEQAERARAEELEKVAAFQASQLSGIETELMGIRIRRSILDKRREALASRSGDEQAIEGAVSELDLALGGVNFTNVALESLDENVFKRALEAIDQQIGNQPLVKARLLQTVADTLRELGLFDRAVPPQTEAIEIRRRVLGEEHPDTIESRSSMGSLLYVQGRLPEAEPVLRAVLEQRQRTFGDEHPETLDALNNIAMLLRDQGKLSEAEPHLRAVLEKRRRVLGEEDPDTLTSINNMGFLLYSLGRFDQAESYIREALEKRRRVLGENHADTLTTIGNVGAVLRARGKLSEAEPYFREALEKQRRVFGEEHPRTLISINNLGILLKSQGKLSEAEACCRDALEKRRRVLGELHPDTLTSISNLGLLLKQQGKPDDAEPYLRDVVEKGRLVLGEAHPRVLLFTSNLGSLLQDQKKFAEAERCYRDAMENRRRVLGDEHPETLNSINNLGSLLHEQGRLDEAEPLWRKSLENRRRALGEEHPDTVASICNLSSLLCQQGEHQEAIDLLTPAEPAARKAFTGGNSPELASFLVLLSRARAGPGYGEERFALAEASLLEAHAILAESRGETHRQTRDCARSIADLYDTWHAAVPDKGYDAKAAEWRSRLGEG